MLLDDLFPVEQLSSRVRHTILAEFGGRRPTVLEVASIPDDHWLKMPAIGPKALQRMRSLTQGARREARISSWAGMTDAELLTEYNRLKDQKKAVEAQLKAVRAELLLRRLLPLP
jgi:hypothetical protein